jgi:hypothetical protein
MLNFMLHYATSQSFSVLSCELLMSSRYFGIFIWIRMEIPNKESLKVGAKARLGQLLASFLAPPLLLCPPSSLSIIFSSIQIRLGGHFPNNFIWSSFGPRHSPQRQIMCHVPCESSLPSVQLLLLRCLLSLSFFLFCLPSSSQESSLFSFFVCLHWKCFVNSSVFCNVVGGGRSA